MNIAIRTAMAENADNKRRSHALSYIVSIASIIIVTFIIISKMMGGIHFKIICNGETLGYVSDMNDYDEIVERVESKMSDELGFKYKFTSDLDFEVSYGKSYGDVGENDLYNKLYAICSKDFTQAHALVIGGKILAANTDIRILSNALDRIEKIKKNEVMQILAESENCTVELSESTHIEYHLVPSNIILGEDDIVDLLCAAAFENVDVSNKPEIKESINNAKKIYLSRELYDSVHYSFDNMYYRNVDEQTGSTNKIELNFLIKVADNVPTEETIPFGTTYTENDFYYDGMSVIARDGETGTRLVVYEKTYINDVYGEVYSKAAISSEVITEPVERIIYKGTKERPYTTPTGIFILPLNDFQISSTYGWRTVSGRKNFHYGIDFYVPMSTPIYASDGGTVVLATESSGAYGMAIKIDHGNGYVSLYGHLSELLVKEGDEVYQGQTIALSGASGRVTGPHLHFEILQSGERINPAGLLRNIRPEALLVYPSDELLRYLKNSSLLFS